MRSRPNSCNETDNMNNRYRTLLATLLTGMLLGGCASTPEEAAPEDGAMAGSTESVDKDIASMVAASFGKGTYEMDDGSRVDFAFDAYIHDDDSVGGFFEFKGNLPGGTIDLAGDVTCFTKNSPKNVAWVGATITRNDSINPGFLRASNMAGSEIWFRVRGAGGNSKETRVSAPGFSGEDGVQSASDFCKKQMWEAGDAGTFVVVQGTLGIFP